MGGEGRIAEWVRNGHVRRCEAVMREATQGEAIATTMRDPKRENSRNREGKDEVTEWKEDRNVYICMQDVSQNRKDQCQGSDRPGAMRSGPEGSTGEKED